MPKEIFVKYLDSDYLQKYIGYEADMQGTVLILTRESEHVLININSTKYVEIHDMK